MTNKKNNSVSGVDVVTATKTEKQEKSTMIGVIKKVASDDVKNLVSGTVSKVRVSGYVDLSMEDALDQVPTDIEIGDEVFLVYQGGSFWLEYGKYMQQLVNSSDEDEDVTYNDEDVAYNIELGDYDCAAKKINLGIIGFFSSEWTYMDFGHYYMWVVHYLDYCFGNYIH